MLTQRKEKWEEKEKEKEKMTVCGTIETQAVIIDSHHGPESPGSTQNSEGHTHVKPSKESEVQGPGQGEGSKQQAMSEEVTSH